MTNGESEYEPTRGEDGPGSAADSNDAEDAELVDPDATRELTDDVVEQADELFDIDRVLSERDEYLDSLRRVQAEFDNYRKRMARQQTELLERAAQSLVERLLPALDALDLAIAHVAPAEAVADGASALPQIAALLRDTLTREGLERIDESGVEFDPTIHDAVAHVPESADHVSSDDDGATPHAHRVVVAEVLRAGYRLKGRVLRPAMVQVMG
jgi:molecular chaperone GrpE